jgi:glutamate-1-semialdehyde 2,1-aminomutase
MSDARALDDDLERRWRARTPGSARLAARAAGLFPSGVTHDTRWLPPYGPYIERADGARKTDVDGNDYVDYFGGHGALLLGHRHPEVQAAAERALACGTHFAAGTELEIRWAEAVTRLIPSAERVRFTASGTEAVMMALRLARACTGRSRVLRFRTHFHGWADEMVAGYATRGDGPAPAGIPQPVADRSLLVDVGDRDALEAAFAAHDDIAAAIVEPIGASFGKVPVTEDDLAALRRLTAAHGALLIFDEVVTGFRVSPGGAQARFGITPDLTTLAKILAGGLPGGAVCGRRAVMERLDHAAARRAGVERIPHPGTFNANPVSAAAGAAALAVVERGEACATADRQAARLRGLLNQVLREEGVPWVVYGRFSGFNLFFNPEHRALDPERFDATAIPPAELLRQDPETVRRLRLAMNLNGADLSGWPGGLVSCVHRDADLERTADALRAAVRLLGVAGQLAR